MTLNPHWDWEKYEYSYRVWGRLLYNPNAEADVWQRRLRRQFGAGAADLESSLANASRILPIVTTSYAPSAANNSYWPELYWNQSLVDGDHPGPYGDSLAPKVLGNASPFDPQLFSRMNDFAAELLGTERTGRYSPIEAAQWIEDCADQTLKYVKQAETTSIRKNSAEYRRMTIDAALQAVLGQFFGAKFRSGVLFGIYEKSGDRSALAASVEMYRKARSKWVRLIEVSKGVYMPDITVGEEPQQRGNWSDRLPAIDKDIGGLVERLEASPAGSPQPQVTAAIQEALGRPHRSIPAVQHSPAPKFDAGKPLEIVLSLGKAATGVRLYYRQVDQAERYSVVLMEPSGQKYRAEIPASYTDSMYPLQYYFEIEESATRATLYPGFSATLTNQPYFGVRERRSSVAPVQ